MKKNGNVDDEMFPAQVSIKKKLFRKLRKFSAKNIENMISLSRFLLMIWKKYPEMQKVIGIAHIYVQIWAP